jgi:hypothetical protein
MIVDIPNRTGSTGLVTGSISREELLKNLCALMSVPYYNLRDHYPKASEQLFIPGDSHWSEAGHAFIAQKVAEWLAENGFMGPAPQFTNPEPVTTGGP